jgi:hypothetical protein
MVIDLRERLNIAGIDGNTEWPKVHSPVMCITKDILFVENLDRILIR